jgi:D-glycero-alpha-D-manno-heptose-7-phosphate kinase
MKTPQRVKISSRAPTRIDLAGGTVDIWPIYLLLQDAITINLGISLFAETHLDWQPSSHEPGIHLQSEDQNVSLKLTWDQLLDPSLRVIPQLELHFKLLRHTLKQRLHSGWTETLQGSLTLRTRAQSPAGAGLGGSSTLSVSMIGALATWAQTREATVPIDPLGQGERLIEIVRDIETTVIRVPAGLQDYYGAMFGGLQCLKWGVGSHERDSLDSSLIRGLQDRLLLFYSGQSRNSGINNWALFKGFIDQKQEVREPFAAIVQATHELRTALLKKDWETVGQAIEREWLTRKGLASGISTPEIDRAFEQAKKRASIAGKVCGAGGGGCFFIYLPQGLSQEQTDLKAQITQIFEQAGMRALPFHAPTHGLQIEVHPSLSGSSA